MSPSGLKGTSFSLLDSPLSSHSSSLDGSALEIDSFLDGKFGSKLGGKVAEAGEVERLKDLVDVLEEQLREQQVSFFFFEG